MRRRTIKKTVVFHCYVLLYGHIDFHVDSSVSRDMIMKEAIDVRESAIQHELVEEKIFDRLGYIETVILKQEKRPRSHSC